MFIWNQVPSQQILRPTKTALNFSLYQFTSLAALISAPLLKSKLP